MDNLVKQKKLLMRKEIIIVVACFFSGINLGLKAQMTLLDEVKISDSGLHFNGNQVDGSEPNSGVDAPYDYFFGPKITVHGDCITTYNEYVFVTWYKGGKANRNVMLTRYNTSTGTMATIEFPHRHTGYQNKWWIGDSHNTIAVAVSPLNGTIHMIYDMHAYYNGRPSDGSLSDDYFRYSYSIADAASVSDENFTLDQFVQNSTGGYKHLSLKPWEDYNSFKELTYPQFFLNDAGDLFVYFRVGGNNNGAYKFSKYSASTSSWSNFTNFNYINAKNYGNNYNWGLYGSMDYVNGKIRIGFQQRSADATDEYQYQNGIYYAYSDNQDGYNGWKNHNGESFSIPLANPEIIKVYEPGDLFPSAGVDQVRIVDGFNWTVTDRGDLHLSSKVQYNPTGEITRVHCIKPTGDTEFTTTTDFSGGASYALGNKVALVGLDANGRPSIKTANGGTNNFIKVYQTNSGRSFEHGKVHIKDGKLYYFLMENTNTGSSSRPIYLQIIDLDLDASPQPLSVALSSPLAGNTLNVDENVQISAVASTDYGNVEKVDFFLDGNLLASDDFAPFSTVWVPTSTGAHTIQAVAYSTTNEVANSVEISVNVEGKDYTDLTGDIYFLKNVETGKYLQATGTTSLTSTFNKGHENTQWTFVKAGSTGKYNIDSESWRGILRFVGSTGGVIHTTTNPPNTVSDKLCSVEYDAVNKNYGFVAAGKFLYHDSNNTISLSTNTDNRSRWIVESTTLSTDNLPQNLPTIKVYPNPTKNNFTIELSGFEKAEIVIHDILGKVVCRRAATSNKLEIKNQGQFKPGIYFIKVATGNQRFDVKKLIIE